MDSEINPEAEKATKTRYLSPEARAAMSEAGKRPKSEETRAKMSASRTGRKRTKEFCTLQSELKKEYWRKKKENGGT
jgi:hypothetical protein